MASSVARPLHASRHGWHTATGVGKRKPVQHSAGSSIALAARPAGAAPLTFWRTPVKAHHTAPTERENTLSQPSRRRAIGLVGGGLVLASTGLVGCGTANPDVSVQAWQPVPPETELRRFMLSHGLLAPNPHNRQPWLADLRREGEISLVCDGKRLLPETDPFGRQILIGCGGFIELAVMAAAQKGYGVQVDLWPQGEPAGHVLPGGRVVARLVMQRDSSVAADPLFAFILKRHTNKNAYDNQKTLPAPLWKQITSAAPDFQLLTGQVEDSARLQQLRKLMRSCYETEMSTARTWLETAHLIRVGPSEITQHRDGIALMAPMVRVLNAVGIFDRFAVPVRGTSGFDRVMQRWVPQETGSGYFWIATTGNSRSQQINTGRAYVRAHLQTTAAGADMHPQSQALQEFAEVREAYTALPRVLGLDPATHTVQMLARVGYAAAPAGPTPRRALQDLLMA